MIRTIALILTLFIGTANAEQAPSGQAEADTNATASDPVHNTLVDKAHRSITNFFQNSIGQADYFFLDDDYQAFGDNPSRMRMRFDVSWVEDHGWDEKFKLKLRLVLPGLSKRAQLVAGGDEDGDNAVAADEDGNDLALRWVGVQSEKVSVSYDVGVRYKSSNLDPFLRLNSGIQYDLGENWYGLTYNRLYYYSDTQWRIDFRQSFNRPIDEDLLFRSRTRVQYFDENDYNPFLEQKFSLFQTINKKSAVAYEALWTKQAEEDSIYDDDEIKGKLQDSYQNVALRLRYRRNVWRDWLYIELWPIIGWAEERDWDTVFGANFRLEATFGGKGKSRLSD